MRLSGLICLFAFGCTPAMHTAPIGQQLRSSPVTAHPARWRLFDGEASPEWFARVPNSPPGIERFNLDGYRAEKVNGRVTVAHQSLSSPMRSCPSGKGFVHFTVENVFWSPTFLGDLVQVGSELVHVAHVFTNATVEECGPVVITHSLRENRRTLWDEHGAHALPAMPGVDFLHFTSPQEGRAIHAPDQLLVTTDGGQTFVAATNRSYPETPPIWLGGALDKEPDEYLSYEAVVELKAAWLHHAMSSEVGAMMDATQLSDGTWVRSLEHHLTTLEKNQRRLLVSLRRTDGTIIDRQLPDCTLAPLRDKLLSYCPRESPVFRSIYPEEHPLATPPKRLSLLVADPEGGVLWAVPGDSDAFDGTYPLLRFDGTTWHLWSTFDASGWSPWPAPTPPLVARHGRLLICGASCVILSALKPSDRGIILDEYTKPYGDDIRGVALLDEEVIAVSSGADSKSVVLHFAFSASGLKLTRKYELSDYMSEASFADAEHGAARNYGYTTDGGKTWIRQGAGGGFITCWPRGCAIGKSLLLTKTPLREPVEDNEYTLTGEPLHVRSRPPVAVAPEKEQPSASRTPDPEQPMQFSKGHLATPASESPKLFPWYDCVTERRARKGAIAGTGGYVICDEVTRTLTWRGRDKAGPFEVEAPFALAGSKSEDYCSKLNLANSPLLTRHYAVIEPQDDNHDSVVVLKEDGSTDTLAVARKLIPRSVLLPDGHGLVIDNQEKYANVFLLDERGARLAHRWLLGEYVPAFGPSGPGVASFDLFHSLYTNGEDATIAFNSLMPGSRPQPLLKVTAKNYLSMLAPCEKLPDPSGTLVYSRLLELAFDITAAPKSRPGNSHIVLGEIEFGATHVCLRGATTYTPLSATLSAKQGVLRGTATDEMGTMEITCRKKMPAERQ